MFVNIFFILHIHDKNNRFPLYWLFFLLNPESTIWLHLIMLVVPQRPNRALYSLLLAYL